MADKMTTTKSDLQAENDRLRALLEKNDIDPDTADDPNLGIVGNLADLQRLGAAAVAGDKTNIDDAVVVPATVDVDTGETTPAQTVSGYEPPMGEA